ncbi:rhamnulokinase [Chelonobacter oris]|uniref:rhamnulokinase n=1 Tax=Chelonobacter oris TaxID=505317 RepID=UPI0024495E75|nr:rhamnulokinase [Chelonobacter oris]
MVMSVQQIAAVDLGAGSGRVMLVSCDDDCRINLREIHRFKNQLKEKSGHFCWDLTALEQEIITGLNKIIDNGETLHSIGIDTWGVDYVLLNQDGEVVGPTYAYRDLRTEGVMSKVQQDIGKKVLYQKTGIQFLPFNTVYQLKAMMEDAPPWLGDIQDFVMIPDYLNYRLTGKLNREYTNATTTQLVNVNTDSWDQALLEYLGVPIRWFGQIRHPGHQIGYWQHHSGKRIPVMSVASHDTASAVIAAPLSRDGSAYLCSGTWSLMGLESKQVCNDSTAMEANITNEGGIDGYYRVLKNIMGLWLFQRLCEEHQISDIPQLVRQASQETPFRSLINPNHEGFLNPVSMVESIRQYCKTHNQPIPYSTAQLARCIFDSLAMLYRKTAQQLALLQHKPISCLHVVGGGCQNEFLNQLCADVCGFDVISGPVEASVLGNVGCQLMALDRIQNAKQFRQWIEKSFPLKHFRPNPKFLEVGFLNRKWHEFCALI